MPNTLTNLRSIRPEDIPEEYQDILETLGIAWIEPVTEKVLTLDLQQLKTEGYTDIRIRL